jgi:hypothetical protein
MHDDSQIRTINVCIMIIYIKPKNSINTFCYSDFVTKSRKHWKIKWDK